MQLRTVIATNFMGASFRVDLDALNLIFGRNDSGKTRLRRAITLLLLGYDPALDKKPAAIFQLSSGKRMELVGEFDNGELIVRTWERKGESVKSVHNVPEAFDGKTPMVLLDANDYFSRSARGRVEMVFSVAKVAIDPAPIVTALKKILGEEIERRLHIPWTGSAIFGGEQEWLEMWLSAVEEQRSSAAEDVRRYTGTLQGVTALQLQDKPPSRDVDLIDQEIDTVQKGLSEAIAEHAKLLEAQEQDEVNELERERLTGLLKSAPKIREFDVNELRDREKRIQQEIEQERDRRRQHDAWEERVQRRDAEIKRLTAELKTLEAQEIDTKPAVCSECRRPLDSAEAVTENINRRQREKRHAIKLKRQNIDSLTAGESWTEPSKPGDTAALEAELTKVRADLDAYAKSVEARGWQVQLQAIPPGKDRKADIAAAAKARQDAADRLSALREERRDAESERADRRRLAQAQTELETAKATEERAKTAKKWLLEKKAELIEQVFGPLLKIANQFMEGIFKQPVEYRDGELGVFVQSSWATEETFGGARRALLYMALQCALGVQSPSRILMADELANIDAENTARLLENIKQAHATGAFEQFIGITPRRDIMQAGFTYIHAAGNNYVRQ